MYADQEVDEFTRKSDSPATSKRFSSKAHPNLRSQFLSLSASAPSAPDEPESSNATHVMTSSEKSRGTVSGTSSYLSKADHRGSPTWRILISGYFFGGRLLLAFRSLYRRPPGGCILLLHGFSNSTRPGAYFHTVPCHGIASPRFPCHRLTLLSLLPFPPPRPMCPPLGRHGYLPPTDPIARRSSPGSPWPGTSLHFSSI